MRGLIQSGLAARARSFQCGAGIVILVVHGGQLLRPADFFSRSWICGRAALTVTGGVGQLGQNAVGDFGRVTDDADRPSWSDRSGRVDVDLDDFGIGRPVFHAVSGQGRERIQTGAERTEPRRPR